MKKGLDLLKHRIYVGCLVCRDRLYIGGGRMVVRRLLIVADL